MYSAQDPGYKVPLVHYENQAVGWTLRKRPSSSHWTMSSIIRNTFIVLGRKLNLQHVLTLLVLLISLLVYLHTSSLNSSFTHLVSVLESSSCGVKGSISSKALSDPRYSVPRKFALHGKRVDSGYLKHVVDTFHKLGYTRVNVSDEWTVLWSHDYPFRVLKDQMMELKPLQKVNHFPGSGYVTNKMNLATSDLPYVPKAFQLPKDKDKLLQYAKNNPHKKFVQKSNNHRGIKIEKIEKLDLSNNSSFIQEYISNPLLIDGHKFDIGVYTILTSINPLRVYIYRDVLFRFCPEKYHPFDPDVVDKYVVGDDYLPTWKVPSLSKYYNDLGFGMKDSFNGWYSKAKGKSSDLIWAQVESAIRTIYLKKESSLIDSTSKFPPGDGSNFFEMVRFDFVIDDDGKVFIMEANMSPNLSSAHFPPNQLLYEQVLFNLMGLVGVGTSMGRGRSTSDATQVSPKHLAVYPSECHEDKCLYDCHSVPCSLCQHCLTDQLTESLKRAYLDQINRGDCIRVFPPSSRFRSEVLKTFDSPYPLHPLEKETLQTYDISSLNKANQLQLAWFRGKCAMEESFC